MRLEKRVYQVMRLEKTRLPRQTIGHIFYHCIMHGKVAENKKDTSCKCKV